MHPSARILIDNNIYISKDIRKYVKQCKLRWQDTSNKFHVLFFSKYQLTTNNIKRIQKLFYRLNHHITFIPNLLTIYIYDYPKSRTISTYIKSHSINGGFTYINSSNIYIYRLDELEKVCIHEIIHHIYKPNLIYCDKFSKILTHKFNTISISLSEALTEFLATIIHLNIISKEYNLKLSILLNEELKHSLELSQKVKSIKNPQITNIISYVILKYIFLLNYKNTLKYLYQPCKLCQILLDFDYDTIIPIKIIKTEKIKFMKYSNL